MGDRSICACCGIETTSPAGWSNPNCISNICCCVNCVLEHKNRYHCICGSCLTRYEDPGCCTCNQIKFKINNFINPRVMDDHIHNQTPRELNPDERAMNDILLKYLGPPK